MEAICYIEFIKSNFRIRIRSEIMQISNTHPMIISEHKRTSYDTDGAVAKVDILRSIRRKDAEPSFLPTLLSNDKDELDKQKQGHQNILRQLFEYFLIATIIICSILLLMNLCGLSLQLTTNSADLHNPGSQILNHQTQRVLNNSTQQFNLSFHNQSTFDTNNQKPVNLEGTEISVDLLYQQFIHSLVQLSQSQESQKYSERINLNEFKKTLSSQGNEHLWRLFLQKFSNNMQCRLQNNKVVCEHEIKP